MKLAEIAQQKYVLLGDGYYMEHLPRESDVINWKIGRLLDENPIGEAFQQGDPFPAVSVTFYDGPTNKTHQKHDDNALDIRHFSRWVRSLIPSATGTKQRVAVAEMWSTKPTNVWLHRLNKDGKESGSHDARRYYKDKAAALTHHNHMVDANPGKEIAHHLHMKTDLGDFKLKLVGKQTGKAGEKQKRSLTGDEFADMMEKKGSAAEMWMKNDRWFELMALYNGGADIKIASAAIPKGADPDKWFKKKVAQLTPNGYRLFDQEENYDSVDMVFVRD